MNDTSQPTFGELLDRGRRFLRSQDHQAAHAIADRLLKDFDASPESLLFAGEVQFGRGNFVGTRDLAERCEREFPEDVSGPILRCRALMAMGRHGEARDIALKVAEREVTDDNHINILVAILAGCLVPEAAYPLCRAAVERDPYNPAAHRRLALNARLIGRLDEAYEAATIALRFDPHDYEMLGLRSSIRTATAENNHIAELEALLAQGCRSTAGAARVAYALAKECEDVGQHDRSFTFLDAGAKIKRQTLSFDLDKEFETFDLLIEGFTQDVFENAPDGCDSSEPVFVLGLPRTGSTLLERILSSHSAVHAAGELFHFDAAMMGEIRKLGPIRSRADLVAKSKAIDPAVVGRNYIERTRPYTGHTPHFIDKRPLNFVSLGVIRLALPRATVFHVRRTPMDTCYAIYKFLFNDAYPWSYDLTEIAEYYVAYRKLMSHWQSVMPDFIQDVCYEDLVGDLEGQARALIERLGIDWEPEVLDFHENEAATMTGSAAQVRRRIYSSSVGRWKYYEKQLKPVADRLEKAGIDPYTP
ncbi:MAG: sulfotransferase [Woeseiaceae bacterium]|nr:sulfotransferase [Woeseiaceae bacterium]